MRCARCSTRRTARPRLANRGERVEDDVDDPRRETERRLVEQQDVGLRDERARDRELLLLAARERARGAASELAHDREELVGALDGLRSHRPASAAGETEPEVLLDRELAEDPPAFGHERDAAARDVLRLAAEERCAAEPDVAGRRPARRP